MVQDRRALDFTAFSLVVLLTALWGFHLLPTFPRCQAAIRSILASVLPLASAQARRYRSVRALPGRAANRPALPARAGLARVRVDAEFRPLYVRCITSLKRNVTCSRQLQ